VRSGRTLIDDQDGFVALDSQDGSRNRVDWADFRPRNGHAFGTDASFPEGPCRNLRFPSALQRSQQRLYLDFNSALHQHRCRVVGGRDCARGASPHKASTKHDLNQSITCLQILDLQPRKPVADAYRQSNEAR
jgi:hypothetical protein